MNVPADLRYTKDHEWLRLEGDVGVIGITDFAQDSLGDVVFVELPAVGAKLTQGATFGVVESNKSVSDLFAPVGGEVIAVNERLAEQPELVNQSPYEDGEVGIRRTVDDAWSCSQKHRRAEMTEGYDMGSADIPDPVAFGWNVADFDIGDPGTDGPLRHDEASGTSWWGSLGDALPMRRTAP